jgi:hypothetical protein
MSETTIASHDGRKHTPPPWRFSPSHFEEGPSAVRTLAGWIVCTTASDEDAAFIVRACNSHEALAKALEKIADLARPGQTLGIGSAIDLICDIYNEAADALSLSRGEAS